MQSQTRDQDLEVTSRPKWYWTKGPGLAKWSTSPHPWTALKRHLRGKVPATYIDQVVSAWFEDVFGYPPSARQGKNPVGKG
jgi:hypothetical protein